MPDSGLKQTINLKHLTIMLSTPTMLSRLILRKIRMYLCDLAFLNHDRHRQQYCEQMCSLTAIVAKSVTVWEHTRGEGAHLFVVDLSLES